MKTLIFNGSPRKNGDTMALVQELIAHLEGEVQVVHAYDAPVKGCIDCRYCWDHPTCSMKDFQNLDQAIQEADQIVLASPIYFGELTGDLLRTLSKVQVYWSAEFMRKEQLVQKPKKGGLILAYAGNCDLDYPLHTARILFRNMRVTELFPVVCAKDTDRLPAAKDEEALTMARALAAFFNEKSSATAPEGGSSDQN